MSDRGGGISRHDAGSEPAAAHDNLPGSYRLPDFNADEDSQRRRPGREPSHRPHKRGRWLMIDASYIKAHPHSAGARGGRHRPHKRGLNSKEDSHGMPVTG